MKKKTNNRIDYKTYRRIIISFGILSVLGLLVIGSLIKYQLVDHDKYKALVLSQLTTETSVNPERGVITDRNGVVLAANKSVYNVIISPHHINARNEEIKKLNSDDKTENDFKYEWVSEDGSVSYTGTETDVFVAKYLAYTLDVKESKIREKMTNFDRKYEVVKKEVEEEVNNKIREFVAKYKLTDQIYDVESSKRYYPYGDLACHILGFTNSEGVGREGLEAYYNNILEGKSG